MKNINYNLIQKISLLFNKNNIYIDLHLDSGLATLKKELQKKKRYICHSS